MTRAQIGGVGLAAGAAAVLALAFLNIELEPGEEGGTRDFVIVSSLVVAVAVALFGWYIPLARRAATVGLAVSTLGLFSVAVFWSGAPFILGPAGAVLGRLGRHEGRRAWAAITIGALAFVLAVAAVISEEATGGL